MTREEAIKEIKILKEDYWEDDGYGYATAECQEATTALDMAIEALKKEIPKPISIESGFGKCGGCGMYIRFPIIDHYNNCPECGQKILWKGDTE